MADAFAELGPIPKPIRVADAVCQPGTSLAPGHRLERERRAKRTSIAEWVFAVQPNPASVNPGA